MPKTILCCANISWLALLWMTPVGFCQDIASDRVTSQTFAKGKPVVSLSKIPDLPTLEDLGTHNICEKLAGMIRSQEFEMANQLAAINYLSDFKSKSTTPLKWSNISNGPVFFLRIGFAVEVSYRNCDSFIVQDIPIMPIGSVHQPNQSALARESGETREQWLSRLDEIDRMSKGMLSRSGFLPTDSQRAQFLDQDRREALMASLDNKNINGFPSNETNRKTASNAEWDTRYRDTIEVMYGGELMDRLLSGMDELISDGHFGSPLRLANEGLDTELRAIAPFGIKFIGKGSFDWIMQQANESKLDVLILCRAEIDAILYPTTGEVQNTASIVIIDPRQRRVLSSGGRFQPIVKGSDYAKSLSRNQLITLTNLSVENSRADQAMKVEGQLESNVNLTISSTADPVALGAKKVLDYISRYISLADTPNNIGVDLAKDRLRASMNTPAPKLLRMAEAKMYYDEKKLTGMDLKKFFKANMGLENTETFMAGDNTERVKCLATQILK